MVCIGVFAGCVTYKTTYQKGLITRTETLEKKTSCPDIRIFKSTNYFMGTDLVHMLRPSYDFIHLPLSKNKDMKRLETSTHAGYSICMYIMSLFDPSKLYTLYIYHLSNKYTQ